MCIMFRDKSITGFFKFLFCSGLRGGLRSRYDRRGPHSIVAGNVSSDSIPGVLGIVSSVESAFGGCLSCSCPGCL